MATDLLSLYFNPISLSADLPGFGQTIRLSLQLDPDIYTLVQSVEQGLTYSLIVVLLAALSEAFGQSLVLFLNRVRPLRYPLALGISCASNVIGYFLWSLVIWLTIWLVFGRHMALTATLIVVGLAYAPQLFAFIELTPYFGNFFGLVLTLWSTAAIVIAIWAGTGIRLWQAAFTGIATWSLIQLWRRSLGRPIYALGQWIEQRASGSALALSVDDVLEGRVQRERKGHLWAPRLQTQAESLRKRSSRGRPGGTGGE